MAPITLSPKPQTLTLAKKNETLNPNKTQNHKPFRPKILKTLSPPTRRPEEANPKPFSPKAPNNYPKPRKPEAPKPPKTLTP